MLRRIVIDISYSNGNIYLIIGLLYGNHQYYELIKDFEEEIDGNDPDEQEFMKNRDELHDQLHNLHRIVGDKGVKLCILLINMLFWLPIIIYTNVVARLKN